MEQDNKILITGSSRGLGKAIAEYLAVQNTVHGFSSKEYDLREKNDIYRCFDTYRDCNVLINNAGLCNNFTMNSPLNDIEDIFAINTFAPMRLSVLFTKNWVENGINGKIINISSRVAKKGCSDSPHYAASKAALSNFTHSWAVQNIDKNIQVFGLEPSWIDTEMLYANAADIEVEKSKLPIGRFIEPKDLFPYFDLFLYNDCSYMTGQVLQINGGSY